MHILGEAGRRPIDLNAVLIDKIIIGCVGARKTDHAPRHHIAVAAVNRIAEEALERALPEMREEHVAGYAAEIFSARLEALEIPVLLVRAHLRKWRLRPLLIDSPKRGVEKLCRRKRELITLAWRSRLPGAAPIEPFARAPRARQLFVDVIGHASFKSAAPFVVFRDQPCDRCFDEGSLVSIEKRYVVCCCCGTEGYAPADGRAEFGDWVCASFSCVAILVADV